LVSSLDYGLNPFWHSPLLNPAEMYTGRVAGCRLVSHSEYADWTDRQTDRQTDARSLHYACRWTRPT